MKTIYIGNMPGGDHCAVWDCDNDRMYPEKQKILPHVVILHEHSTRPRIRKMLCLGLELIGLKVNHFLCEVEKMEIGRLSSDAQLNMSTVSAQVLVILFFLHVPPQSSKRKV